MMLERLLRAGAAVVGGLQLAVDHLRTPIDMDPTIPTIDRECPVCQASLAEGPHLHDGVWVWPTDEDGSVLLTDADGTNPSVITKGTP